VVTARCGEIEAEAQVRVRAAKPDETDGDGDADDEQEKGRRTKIIRWSGTIPPQKWTTFYMKVVSPFVNVAGLRLRAEVELPAEKDEQQAKAQLEKIRGALRDLGLDEDPETR
jgi:hypothetical protein